MINAAFTPSADEVRHAEEIVAAFEAHPDAGVLSVGGKMVDRPHLVQARRVLESSERGSRLWPKRCIPFRRTSTRASARRELAELHDLAAADPDRFWLDQARRLTWNKFPTKAGDWSFDEDDFHISWYADGELNLSVNCLDRHLAEHGDRTALIFEADEPGQGHRWTYRAAL